MVRAEATGEPETTGTAEGLQRWPATITSVRLLMSTVSEGKEAREPFKQGTTDQAKACPGTGKSGRINWPCWQKGKGHQP